jgi:hypothetical protein
MRVRKALTARAVTWSSFLEPDILGPRTKTVVLEAERGDWSFSQARRSIGSISTKDVGPGNREHQTGRRRIGVPTRPGETAEPQCAVQDVPPPRAGSSGGQSGHDFA